MKQLLIVVLGLLVVGMKPAAAQEEFDDLLSLYIDEKYDKLIDKAYRYTQNDKYKRHPLPYIYASMGYFEMSKDGKYRDHEDFKNSQKNALKYAYKFRSKDKELKYWIEYQDYLSDLRGTVVEDAENYLDVEKTVKKALSTYKYLVKIDPEDGPSWLLKGYCEVRLRMVTEAVKSFNSGVPLIHGIEDLDDLDEGQVRALKSGITNYSDYLVENGASDSAQLVMDLGTKLFEKDEEYNKKIDEIKSK